MTVDNTAHAARRHDGDPAEHVAHGHRRGAHIVLNESLFAADPAARARFGAALAEIAARADGCSEDDVTRVVRDELARADIEVSEVEVTRLVEHLLRARGITHVSTGGDELRHRDPIEPQPPGDAVVDERTGTDRRH